MICTVYKIPDPYIWRLGRERLAVMIDSLLGLNGSMRPELSDIRVLSISLRNMYVTAQRRLQVGAAFAAGPYYYTTVYIQSSPAAVNDDQTSARIDVRTYRRPAEFSHNRAWGREPRRAVKGK